MDVPDTRISLLRRLRDMRDWAAWTEFCEIYERVIYRIAIKYGLQDADAREISQDVLIVVAQRIEQFDVARDGRFRSWLSTVARNATIDRLRKDRRQCVGGSDIHDRLQQLASPDAPTDAFDWEARRELFRWAAVQVSRSVNEPTWQAFWKTAIDGEAVEAVARGLGVSVGTVYVSRSRVLSKIKQLVEPFREDCL